MKNAKVLMLALALSPLVMSCATNYADKSPSEIGSALTVKDSEFDQDITIGGPPAFTKTRRGIFVDNETTRLVVVKNKTTGVVRIGLYVDIVHSDSWRFYNSISLTDGTRIESSIQNNEIGTCSSLGCVLTEAVVVKLTPEQIPRNQDFKFRVNSRNGVENTIVLPASYIQGFFDAVRARGIEA